MPNRPKHYKHILSWLMIALIATLAACNTGDEPEPTGVTEQTSQLVQTEETSEPVQTEETTGDERMNEREPYVFEVLETYRNPIEIEGQYGADQHTGGLDYGIGDPFVMRFDGRYYLYASSNGERVKVFQSSDLVNWTDEGYITEGRDVNYAYAPEVTYYNGSFYMATSPSGNGHYILKSDNPLGPFELITDNIGHRIDGSFWITDDDRVLFYYPEGSHIYLTEMDPDTMLPLREKSRLNATLKWWTEGPGIFRRGDYHFLTYTGNHLISTGYRVAYSYSTEGPDGRFIMPDDNLIYISSEFHDDFYGLGHSSNVIGPDLDSVYAPYHNMLAINGPQRRYNLDRLLTNGSVVYSTGATDFDVPMPDRPQISGWFDGSEEAYDEDAFATDGTLITSRSLTGDTFTAEYNFTVKDPGAGPVLMGMGITDDGGWSLEVDPEAHTLSLYREDSSGREQIGSADLSDKHDYTKLSAIRIENTGRRTYVYFNGSRKLDLENTDMKGGQISIDTEHAVFGYVGAGSSAMGSGDHEAVKNIPGKFASAHYLNGENRGFNIANAELKEDGFRPNEPEHLKENANGSASLILDTPGDWVTYPINVEAADSYLFMGQLDLASSGASFDVILEGSSDATHSYTVSELDVSRGETANVTLGILPLEEGFQTLTIRLTAGSLISNMLEFVPANTDFEAHESVFDLREDRDQWIFYGPWKMSDNTLTVNANQHAYATFDTDGLSDYEMNLVVDVPQQGNGEAGVMFRVTHPSIYEHQVKESFIGYGIQIGSSNITMSKYNYGKIGSTHMVSSSAAKDSDTLSMRIVVESNRIQVYLQGEDEPSFDHYDAGAWLYGRPGFFTFGRELTVREFSVKTLD